MVAWLNPAPPVATSMPATAASAPEMAQASPNIRPAGTPRARAVSWLAAVARMASPRREWRRNSQSRATTVAVTASLARSEWNDHPGDLGPLQPPGVADLAQLQPDQVAGHDLEDDEHPDGDHGGREHRLADHGPQGDPLHRRPDQGGDEHGHGQGGPEPQPTTRAK